MSKRIINLLVVATLLVAVGCNDLLEDPSPATAVPGEQVLTDPTGIDALRASMYYRVYNSFGYTTQYFVGPSAIADLTEHRIGASRMQDLNTLNGSDGGTNGLSSYGATYGIILDANMMISAVEDGVIPQSKMDRYRGEAYALRAMAMHNLVRALGYEPGKFVDGFDLGIPIITTPTQALSDVKETPRATVGEVYNQILSDLNQAKSLLSGVNSDNTYVTEAFVDGLLARVNLYAGNWSAAATSADNAIANSPQSLATDSATVVNMFDENAANHPEALFKIIINPSTEQIAGDTFNDGLATYTSTGWTAQIPTNKLLDLYSSDDWRLGSYQYDENGDPIMDPDKGGSVQLYQGGWFERCYDESASTPITGCTAVNDDTLEIQKWSGDKGQQTDDIPYMRIAELYLIKAEAQMKANDDYTQGLPALNTLRNARGLDDLQPVIDISSNEELMNEILDERARELAVEGHRWWDLKRLGMDVPYPDGSTKVRYDSYRILDNIGAGNISANPALEENPGY